ncbi:MAG TPA: ABC transporter permease [Candidatus Scybalocola faecavium]|nr:ABC transporter permease [Candidatus Scybalocola faecavium]
MFLLKSVLGRMRYQMKICVILVLAIAAGLLCPIYVLGHISALYSDIGRFAYDTPENVLILSDSRKAIKDYTAKNVERALADYEYGYECLRQVTIDWDGTTLISTVGGATPGIFSLSPYVLESGRNFTEQEMEDTGTNVCIVKTTSDFAAKGGAIGDKLRILGREFEVVGLFDSTRILASVIVPYPVMGEISGENNMQHRFVLSGQEPWNEENIELLTTRLNRIGGLNVSDPMTAIEEDEQIDASIKASLSGWLIIGGIVMIFALLSVGLILMGCIINEQYSYGIRRGAGAGMGRLFLEALAQNLILVAAAFAMDALITASILGRVFPFSLNYNAAAFGVIGAVGVIIALILSGFTALAAGRRQIRYLLDASAYGL